MAGAREDGQTRARLRRLERISSPTVNSPPPFRGSYLPDIRALIARTASSFKDHYFSLVAHRRRWKPGEPYCSRARNPLFLYLRLASLCSSLPTTCRSLSFIPVYTRTHFHSPVSLLAIFHASTGWHVRRRILRNSMEIARVPETALERISRHRVSQRRTPRLDIPIRYTAGTCGSAL